MGTDPKDFIQRGIAAQKAVDKILDDHDGMKIEMKGPPDGGDIIFTPGKGDKEGLPIPGRDGRIIFMLADGTEALRLDPNGDFFVKGIRVQLDVEVYDAFRSWVMKATALLDPGAEIRDI